MNRPVPLIEYSPQVHTICEINFVDPRLKKTPAKSGLIEASSLHDIAVILPANGQDRQVNF